MKIILLSYFSACLVQQILERNNLGEEKREGISLVSPFRIRKKRGEKINVHVGPPIEFSLLKGAENEESKSYIMDLVFCPCGSFFLLLNDKRQLHKSHLHITLFSFLSLFFSTKQQKRKYTFLFIFSFLYFISFYFLSLIFSHHPNKSLASPSLPCLSTFAIYNILSSFQKLVLKRIMGGVV